MDIKLKAKFERRLITLKALADMMDAHPSSVRRWLREAGIQPVALGRSANGAIRYRWDEADAWLKNLPKVS